MYAMIIRSRDGMVFRLTRYGSEICHHRSATQGLSYSRDGEVENMDLSSVNRIFITHHFLATARPYSISCTSTMSRQSEFGNGWDLNALELYQELEG